MPRLNVLESLDESGRKPHSPEWNATFDAQLAERERVFR